MRTTKEKQYNVLLEISEKHGLTQLGLMMNQVWRDDPRRLAFVLARYKFVSKMLTGKRCVLEIGCGDAFGTRIVQQEVGSVCAVDFDPLFVDDIKARMDDKWAFDCRVHDILSGPVSGMFDGAYSLDVLEHIPKESEETFMTNVCASLDTDGVLIVGIPSIQSQAFASPASKEGHVNCKDHQELRQLMLRYFRNVFLFSMNDEMVHTGYFSMAHYLLAVCAGNKQS